MADNYRVEVSYWYRTKYEGDWDFSEYWMNFNTLEEALHHVKFPRGLKDNLIDARVYDVRDEYKITDANLIYAYNYKTETVTRDWTTVPDFDYHNREYPNAN
jgi:hypothetical protein